jgi:DNA-binding HxlR family transcriptional regulator
MVSRKIYPTVPVTVEYALTPLGRSLGEAVAVIRNWAYGHMSEIEAARDRYDRLQP